MQVNNPFGIGTSSIDSFLPIYLRPSPAPKNVRIYGGPDTPYKPADKPVSKEYDVYKKKSNLDDLFRNTSRIVPFDSRITNSSYENLLRYFTFQGSDATKPYLANVYQRDITLNPYKMNEFNRTDLFIGGLTREGWYNPEKKIIRFDDYLKNKKDQNYVKPKNQTVEGKNPKVLKMEYDKSNFTPNYAIQYKDQAA